MDSDNFLLDLLNRDDGRRSPDGVCYGFEDGMDGFAIHADGCASAGISWRGPGSSCPRQGYWRGSWPEWVRK